MLLDACFVRGGVEFSVYRINPEDALFRVPAFPEHYFPELMLIVFCYLSPGSH